MRLFGKPTADEIARRELADTRIALLSAQSNLEYFTNICNMYVERIARLEEITSRPASTNALVAEKSKKLPEPKHTPSMPTLVASD